jgi:MoaA/NifB/PqqE/SkfB family radical SAM enzyme
LKNAVEQIRRLQRSRVVVTLTGGEPTIHPNYIELVEYIISSIGPGTHVLTISNLSRPQAFYQNFCDKLAHLRHGIAFKCSYHYEYANPDGFISSAELLANHDIDVHISIMAHPGYWDQVMYLYTRLKRIQCKKLHYDVAILRDNYGSKPDKRYSKKQLEWFKKYYTQMEKIETVGDEVKDIIVEFYDKKRGEILHENYSPMELIANKMNSFKGMYCNAGINMIAINDQGDLSPAVCFTRSPGKKNIYKDDFAVTAHAQPIICPFNRCGCVADLQIPKFSENN